MPTNPFALQNDPSSADPTRLTTPEDAESLQAAIRAESERNIAAAGGDPVTGAPVSEESTLGSAIADMAIGAGHGVLRSLDAAGDLIEMGADALGIPGRVVPRADGQGYELITGTEARARGIDEEEFFNRAVAATEPTSIGGNITAGISQVITALVGGFGAVGAASRALPAAAQAGRAAASARNVAGPTLADVVGFHGDEFSLADMVSDNLGVQGAVIDYFADREGGDTAENRLKAAIEGFVAGAVVDTVVMAMRFIKRARAAIEAAPDANPDEVVRQFAEENADELRSLQADLTDATSTPEALRAASAAPAGSPASRRFAQESRGFDVPTTEDLDAVAGNLGADRSINQVADVPADISDEAFDAQMRAAQEAGREASLTDEGLARAGIDAGTDESLTPDTLGRIADDAEAAEAAEAAVRAAREQAGIPQGFEASRPVVETNLVEGGLRAIDDDPFYVSDRMPPSPFNHARMDSPEGVQEAVAMMAQVIRPQLSRLSQEDPLTFEQIRQRAAERLADVTDIGVDSLLASTARMAETADAQAAELLASRQLVQSLARQAQVLSRRIASDQGTDADRRLLMLVSQQWGDLSSNLLAIRRGAARATAAGRITASDALGEDEVSSALFQDAIARGDVDILASQINSMNGRINSILPVLKNPPSTLRKFTEFYINSLLSNPTTHALNAISNSAQMLTLPVEKMLGGALTGRMTDVQEGMRQYWYMAEAIPESTRAVATAFRSGNSVLDTVDKLDEVYSKVAITSDSATTYGAAMRAFGNVVRIPTRLLTTGDEVFKQVNYRAAVKARAHLEAAQRYGDDTAARAAFVKRATENAFHPVTGRATDQEALAYAREATFTTPLEAGQARVDVARGIQAAVRTVPALRFIAPFVRTPSWLIRNAIQRTPVLGAFQKQMWDDIRAGGTRRSRAIGKQVMGMGVASAALMAAHSGRITGGGPADPVERANLEATGWRPYSFVATDAEGNRSYISHVRGDPFSQLLGVAADMYYMAPHIEDGEYEEVAVALGASFARNIAQKSYLTGVTAAMEAFTDTEDQFARWAQQMAAGFVPAGARPVASAIGFEDPYVRETRGLVDKLKSKIPGLSSSVTPRIDWVTGQPVKYPEGYLWGETTLFPFPRTNRTEDLVVNELANLPHGFQGPPRTMNGVELTQEQHTRWEELHGTHEVNGMTMLEALEEAMMRESYDLDRTRGIPDVADDPSASVRVTIVNAVIGAYRQASAAALREEDPDLRQAWENQFRLRGGLMSGQSDEPEILQQIRARLARQGNERYN